MCSQIMVSMVMGNQTWDVAPYHVSSRCVSTTSSRLRDEHFALLVDPPPTTNQSFYHSPITTSLFQQSRTLVFMVDNEPLYLMWMYSRRRVIILHSHVSVQHEREHREGCHCAPLLEGSIITCIRILMFG
jgi:hypothetical protein